MINTVVVSKKWYTSKIVWINVISLISIAIQEATGKEIITPELQIIGLSAINLFLRTITHENIIW